MKRKDFLDSWFWAYCQQEYDKARQYLRFCGKPKTDIDRFYIEFNKDTVRLMHGFLFGSKKTVS